MRILYIHQFFATRDSSHPTRSYEFARRLAARGHDVVMLTGSSRLGDLHSKGLFSDAELDGINVRSVRNEYSNYMGHARRIWSFVLFMAASTITAMRGPKPDVVFATSTPLTVAIPGWVASRWHRVPYVFEVRDPWPDAAFEMGALRERSLLGRLARWLERFTYRHADALVALSPGMTDYMTRQGADSARISTIPNCSDLDLFRPGPKDTDIVARFGLDGRFVVGYTGAIGPANAVHVIAEAAALLAKRGRHDISVLIAGDGKRLPAVRAYVEEHSLDDVHLIGSVPKTDLPALLRTCDAVLVHLAKVEVLYTGSPNKLFDGLASGRPIIVNSPGWTKPLVTENEAGVFVEPENAPALADAIERLADDPEGTRRMGANARRLAESAFDRDARADELAELLERVSG